ncbi:hypothetical protein [Nonomuraea turcica]|uniref:hypothetical protein n=1 Tax=Nonomuraea sp. G32 TaxID=3067274 RepID=UPI00273B127E|nr:hypothetical protein [Nonomuraea sp. G32]MDP4511024.1 hypothetical protein [Nonomuraea sp. G32]
MEEQASRLNGDPEQGSRTGRHRQGAWGGRGEYGGLHVFVHNVQTWLASYPRFHMHFAPTSASRLNQVERWFGLITDKLIRRGVHTSVTALEKDILAWVDIWNEDAKPFVWIKTAEEILASLELLLRRIKGEEH